MILSNKYRFKIPFAVLITVLFIFSLLSFFYHKSFTTTKWRNSLPTKRKVLAESFLSDIYKEGMTVSQVKEYLGEPDFNGPTKDSMSYLIGLDSIEYIVLSFQIDNKGKTFSPTIWQTS